MKANQVWQMRASAEDKQTIRRVARRFGLKQSRVVKILIRIADEVSREEKPEERKPITA